MILRVLFISIICQFLASSAVVGQTDTTKRKSRFVVLPAISYSPETKLTLGAFGSYYFDLANGNSEVPMSALKLILVYSTGGTIVVEPKWEFYTPEQTWMIRGRAFYNRFPDRHYGFGNDANTRVVEFEDENFSQPTILNYLRYNTDRIHFETDVLRKIRENLFVGLNMEFERLYRYRVLPEFYAIQTFDDLEINPLDYDINAPTPPEYLLGNRSGIGVTAVYDDRINTDNPLKGHFIRFQNLFFSPIIGSNYTYSLFKIDARKYINTYKDQTLALQLIASNRFTQAERVPVRGLSRMGGSDFQRGYFFGTYQDKNALAFQAEYRLPIFNDYNAPVWKVWRHLGIVIFGGTSQTYDRFSELSGGDFRYTAGGGLRIMINNTQRVNIRIDYGVGFAPNAGGDGRMQSGFYFFLGEAF